MNVIVHRKERKETQSFSLFESICVNSWLNSYKESRRYLIFDPRFLYTRR